MFPGITDGPVQQVNPDTQWKGRDVERRRVETPQKTRRLNASRAPCWQQSFRWKRPYKAPPCLTGRKAEYIHSYSNGQHLALRCRSKEPRGLDCFDLEDTHEVWPENTLHCFVLRTNRPRLIQPTVIFRKEYTPNTSTNKRRNSSKQQQQQQ